MLDRNRILKILKNIINDKLLKHSIGVEKTAIKLAKVYKAETEKAAVAGLLHDCAKGFTDEQLLKKAVDFDILLDSVSKQQPQLIHGPVGAQMAKHIFGVDDIEIIRAIEIHTTGDQNMSVLDKIVYLADYVEPDRDFPGVDALRKLAFENLDKACLFAFNNTLKYVIDNNWLIHPKTVIARNDILMKMGN
ncbi:MAG: hypothetical protein PWQ82_573 [Thermosediminibacterales bacterium]|nr:hypothetical protein [Thermosediminibacterales bacterium]MDK2835499.1 hypothetical protein [Thermosediminibacterales bacterium]